MSVLLALVATLFTSLLPILSKYLLRDTAPERVAWATNAASLPILAIGTFVLTQCSSTSFPHMFFSCTVQLPRLDRTFGLALLGSAVLNWAATLLSTYALAKADASLVSPLLTFNPAFTLLIAWLTLDETPGLQQSIGVVVILLGTYLLDIEEARTGMLAPLRVLLRRPGAMFALIASACWGTTTVLEKLAIEHMIPSSGPFVALLGTVFMVMFLTPNAFLAAEHATPSTEKKGWSGLRTHPYAFSFAVLLAGIAPLFGFTAIALGLVGYVTALFKLSGVFTIFWAKVFLGEGNVQQRLFGAMIMLVGGALIAL